MTQQDTQQVWGSGQKKTPCGCRGFRRGSLRRPEYRYSSSWEASWCIMAWTFSNSSLTACHRSLL